MDTGIVVFEDVDGTFVRCERCGLTCLVPRELLASSIDDFYRQHHRDVDVSLHPAECPSWPVQHSELLI